MKRILFLTLALVLLLGLVATPVMAAKPAGEQEALNNAIVKGADLHLSRQGTYGGIPNCWEWEIDRGISGANVLGISATGLLAAYEKTNDIRYLNGAIAAGNTLVTRYDPTTAGRPYSQDVEFLVRLSKDSGDATYATKAATYYARVMAAYTAVQLTDRYINARLSLAGWDLASQIRAALAVGEVDYAAGMAARLIERRADWEGVLYSGWDYTTSSYASLLWAFAEIADNRFNSYVGEIREALVEGQASDGSWDDGDYQSTAYAILGLDADGTARGVQAKAWAFLRDTQTTLGGWSYPPGYGEVNSEVLMALGALDLKGVQAGKTDPQPSHGKDTGKHQRDPAY